MGKALSVCDDLLKRSERRQTRATLDLLFCQFLSHLRRIVQSLPASFRGSIIEMFAVLLFLVFSASHVQYAVNGFPANTLALPQVNETHGALGDKNDTLASNISDLL